MTGKRRQKIVMSMVLVLIVTILPTAAVLRADNAAKPMMSHDFTDVPVVGQEFMEPFIDAFYHMGITGGCSTSPLMYCPTNPVTRGSMAVFMGRALGYVDMGDDLVTARAYFKQTSAATNAHGVLGRTIAGIGVFGDSETGTGVAGISDSNYGVYGLSDSGFGVYGSSTSNYGVSASSGSATALFATTATQNITDTIYDISMGGSTGELFGSALHFFSNAGMVIDLDNDNNAVDAFVIRNSANTNIFVVDESGNLAAGGSIGALGIGTNTAVTGSGSNGFGVSATSTGSSGLSASGAGNLATDATFDIVLAGTLGELFGSNLHFFSNDDFTIDLDNDNTSVDSFIIRDSTNLTLFSVDETGGAIFNGDVEINGDYTATGSKSAIVSTVSHGDRLMYAVEATEVVFEDMGTAQLVDGVVVIEFDPIFAETVNLDEPYQVFLTPVGGWAELYVEAQSATSFTVRATDPDSDLQFHYRIVAKRLGYEDVRMEEVTP